LASTAALAFVRRLWSLVRDFWMAEHVAVFIFELDAWDLLAIAPLDREIRDIFDQCNPVMANGLGPRKWEILAAKTSGRVKLKSLDHLPRSTKIAPEKQALTEDMEGLELHLKLLKQQTRLVWLDLVLNGDVGSKRSLVLTRKLGRERFRYLIAQLGEVG